MNIRVIAEETLRLVGAGFVALAILAVVWVITPKQDKQYVVQYRRKETADWCGFDPWHSMAAFDVLGAAESYYAKQDSDMWEYRLIEITGDEE